MPTLKDADEFFSGHLLKEKYFAFSDSERSAAVTTASSDINAVIKSKADPGNYPDIINTAIFEQAIYLLLNPHILSGAIEAEKAEIISPRAQILFDAIRDDNAAETTPDFSAAILRINRG